MAYELNEGQGKLFRNDKKAEGSKQPDYRGEVKLNGALMEVAGWLKEGKRGKWMSLAVKAKDASAAAPKRQSSPADDIPW